MGLNICQLDYSTISPIAVERDLYSWWFLLGGWANLRLWKMMEWKSGRGWWTSQYDGKIVKFMFQTTKQYINPFFYVCCCWLKIWCHFVYSSGPDGKFPLKNPMKRQKYHEIPKSGLRHRVHRPPAVHPTHVASPGARNAHVLTRNMQIVPELWTMSLVQLVQSNFSFAQKPWACCISIEPLKKKHIHGWQNYKGFLASFGNHQSESALSHWFWGNPVIYLIIRYYIIYSQKLVDIVCMYKLYIYTIYTYICIYGPVLRLSTPPHGLGPQVVAPIPFYLQAIGSISEVQLRIC